MTITRQKPLRLWPGVVAVALQWLVWFVLPLVVPGGTAGVVSAFGGLHLRDLLQVPIKHGLILAAFGRASGFDEGLSLISNLLRFGQFRFPRRIAAHQCIEHLGPVVDKHMEFSSCSVGAHP